MKTEFTKGEWSLPHFATKKTNNDCDCGFILAHDCEVCVATIHYKKDNSTEQSEHPDLKTAIANAKLISAAPELLIALSNLLDELEDQPISSSTNLYIENAKEAIKKATE